jgi:hypothetical protein
MQSRCTQATSAIDSKMALGADHAVTASSTPKQQFTLDVRTKVPVQSLEYMAHVAAPGHASVLRSSTVFYWVGEGLNF